MSRLLSVGLLFVAGVAGADARFDKTHDDLEALIAKATGAYQPVGAPTAGQLEAYTPRTVELKRGQCYMMVLRLANGATWSEHARRGVVFVYMPVRGGDGFEINGGPGIAGPGGVGSGGCPQKDGTYAFDVRANWGSAMDKSHIHDLGVGPFTLQLMAKPNSPQNLAAQKADQDRQSAETEAFKRQSLRDACVRCNRQKDDCFDGRHRPFGGSCGDEYRSCLFRSGVRDEGACYVR